MKNLVTREHFDGAIATLRQDIRDILKMLAVMREKIGNLQGSITKAESAATELLPTEQYLRNLVGQLQIKGLALDEGRIFTSKQ